LKANPKHLIALAAHPQIEIKIYNPVVQTGVSKFRKYYNLITNFKKFNQRMHDKTFIVDGVAGITGGRNMADEYFDYDNKYTFRDRDILLIGDVVSKMNQSFELYWKADLAVKIESLYPTTLLAEEIKLIYQELHQFAKNKDNYPLAIKEKINNLDQHFETLTKKFNFNSAKWLFDLPGKNQSTKMIGGGHATNNLIQVLSEAKKSILIQSPYLVFDDSTLKFFEALLKKGIKIKISTNSLESTDNLAAFAGYHKNRKKLLAMGIQIYEFKAQPKILKKLMQRYQELTPKPIFALHAKSLVVDRQTLYIGTFNFDPRSINLNTEVGVLIKDKKLAKKLNFAINQDILPENSYDLKLINPDQYVPWQKRFKLWLLKLLPIQKIL
ncbi:MAG: phospholipase D-like domain-containing protein, partial [Candidatus Paceibacterota bacterium]